MELVLDAFMKAFAPGQLKQHINFMAPTTLIEAENEADLAEDILINE